MPKYATEWVHVAGRRVKIATGEKSQTINICTPSAVDGQYEEVVRLRDRFINPHDLERLAVTSVPELVRYLVVEYGGKPERGNASWRSGVSSTPSPLLSMPSPATGGTQPSTPSSTNSKQSRVEPVFCWLRDHGGPDWPGALLQLTEGLVSVPHPGGCEEVLCTREWSVGASPQRLAWMIRNAERLIPRDGREWRTLRERVTGHPQQDAALQRLDLGAANGIPPALVLEGSTHCDCLIECRNALLWIEGKRHDWLDPSIKWDTARDQLSRNLEAAWIEATRRKKAYYCVVICHEFDLKYHEQLLVDGYRAGTWIGGWPHLGQAQRQEFAGRIGTVRWSAIAQNWPELRRLPALHDLNLSEE
jgi:hypothetical protein